MINKFCHMKVISDPNLTEAREITVKRSLKERLFSLPWRPFEKLRVKVIQVPSEGVYILNEHTCAIHPNTERKFSELLKKLNA